jgi:membrane associated rhomboid family serine protease
MQGAIAGVMYYSAVLHSKGKIETGTISAFLFYMLYLVTNFVITSIAVSGMFACIGAADKIVHLMEC